MTVRKPRKETCSVSQTLEIIGDQWSILILRDCFLGIRRFGVFEKRLGIAKNILSDRLAALVKHGVLEKVEIGKQGTRFEYQLTGKGKDLIVIVTALRQWGDRWIYGEGNEPAMVVDRRTGRPIPRLRLLDEAGEPLRGRDIELRPGPGYRPHQPNDAPAAVGSTRTSHMSPDDDH